MAKKINILINGLGRVGKSIFRQVFDHLDFIDEIRINASSNLDQIIHQIKYDSLHGIFAKKIECDKDYIYCEGKKITISHAREIENINLKDIDIVFECTGNFNSKIQAQKYLNQGVKRVLISAPCDDSDATIIFGVNHSKISKGDLIISAGSCTTNCLAPICKILNSTIGIEKGYMTTIHSYTNDQRVLDGSHKDKRRSRASALSIIPTSTGATKIIGDIIPELNGKIGGSALRVPTPNVSLIDFTFTAMQNTSVTQINEIFLTASNGQYKNIVEVAKDELVSVDFNGNKHSAIIDPFETKIIDNNLVRILAWYDNETAFAARMIDIARYIHDT